jgi:23S rRNA (adenine-N6)-dimethyltransferase
MSFKQRLLSQNYLTDKNLVSKLVNLANFSKDDCVIEIGPGKGIITEELAKQCKQVIAIEIDQELSTTLLRKFNYPNIRIHCEDILRYDLPNTAYKVFANIPYHITADIIYKLLYYSNPPTETYLILQREAAEKFSGNPNTTQFSVVSHPWFTFEVLWCFKKSDFYPPPSVDSVLLKISKRQIPLIEGKDKLLFESFIKYAFHRWKSNLKLSLKTIFTFKQWRKLCRANNFSINAKPSELSGDQWLMIFKFLKQGIERKQINMQKGIRY